MTSDFHHNGRVILCRIGTDQMWNIQLESATILKSQQVEIQYIHLG